MAAPVKPTRSYDSSRRRQQAAATRTAILEAAHRLFEEQGYPKTTMAAIAQEAGVALKTVYLAFETKAGVLRALWNAVLRGGVDAPPITEHEWFAEMVAEPDPERQLRLNARNSRAGKERIGAIFQVVRSAADEDPDAAELFTRIQSDYHANQRGVVESLRKKRALARGLTVDRGADILWTINHPDVWQLLVVERGWAPEQYERWCADSACAQLLQAGSTASPTRTRPGRSTSK
jgi:AcrR family transcriptional regulator